jgi:DsbC/DsbD-like thiol-disulfide interchange protein/cytochrome c biogenesis protein CcdA
MFGPAHSLVLRCRAPSNPMPRFFFAPFFRKFAIFLVAVCGLLAQSAAQIALKDTVQTPQVRAQLLAHAPDGTDPGKPVWVGLQIEHQPEWHTYWKNAGDSGLPTQLSWSLPKGVTAGDIAWPVPERLPVGPLVNLGYSNTVLLPVPLKIGPDFKPTDGHLQIQLRANWLVCKKECIPEEGEFAVKVPVRGSTATHSAAFEAAWQAQPRALPQQTGGSIPPSLARLQGNNLQLEVQGLPVEWRGKPLHAFPETAEVIDNGAPARQEWQGAVWRVSLPLAAQRSTSPNLMPFVWTVADATGPARFGVRAELPVRGNWPQAATVAAVPAALDAALKANAAASQQLPASPPLPLWWALVGALLGGLILNLMPCVFPVLAIKALAFSSPGGDVRVHRQMALAYTVGVVVSFLALAGLLLALRAAGEQLGWGFQLQSPAVVAVLAALFTLLGLNLAGMFEFGNVLPAGWAGAQLRHPALNAGLSGVLAVAVASPCTAPFMGASLGLAVTLPTWQALLVFGTLGLGLALPFLLAGFVPGVVRLLPRPGAWMVSFKQFMAFPMFATVAWLLWVLGQQSGIDGAASLLVLLLAMALLLWTLQQSGRVRWVLSAAALTLCALLLVNLGPQVVSVAAAPGSRSGPDADGRWQAWTPGKVEQLLAEGKPVLPARSTRRQHSAKRTCCVTSKRVGSHCCAPTGRGAIRPSRQPWPSSGAAACRCMWSTCLASRRACCPS